MAKLSAHGAELARFERHGAIETAKFTEVVAVMADGWTLRKVKFQPMDGSRPHDTGWKRAAKRDPQASIRLFEGLGYRRV